MRKTVVKHTGDHSQGSSLLHICAFLVWIPSNCLKSRLLCPDVSGCQKSEQKALFSAHGMKTQYFLNFLQFEYQTVLTADPHSVGGNICFSQVQSTKWVNP